MHLSSSTTAIGPPATFLSSTKPLKGQTALPSTGKVTASWAGGPVTTLTAGGGPFSLEPAQP